ncbi:uncharacterized protein (DUF2236 family) [Motilibacter peucedani]|uniref:Uncharacterized protein (DUF2236 family) n=1 Tax=Motilibacter peucedani TaxID=598650 RepID=A0A420XVF8_9ACTN|nr:oxygenase MpaB family protein [Motilibacter peucedani]RKS84277.1 uncharacterized protein (DUF2236 family) [Motilibacter peucedani]
MSARLPLRACFPPPQDLGRAGDAGVVEPGGVLQRRWADRLLLTGGPAAILMQVAHPLVAAGVTHSDYRERPGHRLLATLELTLAVTFGDTSQARAAVARVARRHTSINGTLDEPAGPLPRGTAYDATDPELALWVYATLVWTALRVHEVLGHPLPTDELEDYWQQSKPFARLFGVGDDLLPGSFEDFTRYVEGTVAGLVVTDPARSVRDDMLQPRLWPPVPGAGPVVRAVTAALLPPSLATAYAVDLTPRRRLAVRLLGSVARVVWPRLPLRLREFPHAAVARHRISLRSDETSAKV